MFKNALFASLLVAFVYVHSADSLMCKTCITPNDCKKAELKECNNNTAIDTTKQLEIIFDNVPKSNVSSHFHCLKLTHVANATNLVVQQLYGCIFPDLKPCDYPLKESKKDYHWRRTECFSSPAGTFSSSPYIIASIFAVLLAKFYA